MRPSSRSGDPSGHATQLGFDGRDTEVNAKNRRFLEAGTDMPIDPCMEPFRPYRKTTVTFAARVPVPFSVLTMEGHMYGQAGDYLAVGVKGEMYPSAAAVFEESYEEAPHDS
jgi:hypothetical protein